LHISGHGRDLKSAKVKNLSMELNEVLEKLPQHLLGLVIDQPYHSYTAQDHAVWRYVMRQNVRFLSRHAHGSYTDGLRKTGISIDTIPHMYGMNRILKEIGWAAVAVDGFIPPAAFMEFQAYNVLVIAADIRPADQIAYTPAPDIIHEAAGHAPIIADPEYSAYLRFFGEIGSKAFSSARDYELYEAIRHLSILKADPYTPPRKIEQAEARLALMEQNMGGPSEMALIRNLHWWTVEYGLIGDTDNFKIFGAGLLSSIGESINCLKPRVKKLPYSIDAANYSFDITTQQPQLFVTPDFNHLNNVLNQFADGMALRRGGAYALTKAEASANTATVELSSGLQISGTFSGSVVRDNEVLYLRTTGPTSLCHQNKEVEGQGKATHPHGFGSPVGRLSGGLKPETMDEGSLTDAGIVPGKRISLAFESGVKAEGMLEYIIRRNGRNLILGFSGCTVTLGGETLFRPEWGIYDMALGESVTSAWPGPADPEAFGYLFEAPAERTHKIEHTPEALDLHRLYQQVRDKRENKALTFDAAALAGELLNRYPNEWLLMTELLELLGETASQPEVQQQLRHRLRILADKDEELARLIGDAALLM
jgi:phenylalanine-4-hydroxylase